MLSLPPKQREFLVDQAPEFAFFRELPGLGGGFVEQGDGLAEGGGPFFASGGVVRLRQGRGVMAPREIPTNEKAAVALRLGGMEVLEFVAPDPFGR
ncbi:MAG: hypothetical protein EXS32_15410 [Opitutus sp.]|nr:hypothetical protein [Opitutus sp.]